MMTSAFERLLGDLSEADVDLESMTETRRVSDHTIRHLNIEGLITLKEESLRHKDQMDVAALRRIREERREK
ncbi:MAG: hypothetical protein BRD54_04465 [Bacteroidetes bacterium SW_8_64_56]|nr:MAG: hypothetical protein BRD54_04465 [Bacteroidetes bacterium SW_8_64_56]